VPSDVAHQLRGVAAAAMTHHVHVFAPAVLVISVTDRTLIEVSRIGFAATCHGDVKQCPGGVFAEDGVPVGDVIGQVVGGEDGAGVVVEAAVGDAVVFGVDGVDAPAVAVCARSWPLVRDGWRRGRGWSGRSGD
jgi:hypothetical protein